MIWKPRDTEDGVYIVIYTFTNSSQSDTLLRNISVNIDRTFQTAEGDFWFGRKVTTLDFLVNFFSWLTEPLFFAANTADFYRQPSGRFSRRTWGKARGTFSIVRRCE